MDLRDMDRLKCNAATCHPGFMGDARKLITRDYASRANLEKQRRRDENKGKKGKGKGNKWQKTSSEDEQIFEAGRHTLNKACRAMTKIFRHIGNIPEDIKTSSEGDRAEYGDGILLPIWLVTLRHVAVTSEEDL